MDLLDFDDLLCLTVRLWEEAPDVLEAYRSRYKRIMIDEYQDTNGVQLRLMTMLAGKEGNLAVVGDDDQSIYGWRGADVENILNFDQVYPGARIIRLEQNYRSTGNILKAANGVISHAVGVSDILRRRVPPRRTLGIPPPECPLAKGMPPLPSRCAGARASSRSRLQSARGCS